MPKPRPKHLKLKTAIGPEVNHYRNLKHGTLSTLINKTETKSIWFSMEQIQEMWDEMIYQVINNGKKVSGIRVYLTTYLPGATFEKQMGIVFVLTENRGTTADPVHKDFFIEEQGDWGSRPLAFASEPLESEWRLLGFDQGTPCPPDCGIDKGQDPQWA